MSSPVSKRKIKPRTAKKRENSNNSEDGADMMKFTLLKPATCEKKKNLLRKSLFDYEREKVMQRGFVLYMQRVFIFVKNLPVQESGDISQQPSDDISQQQLDDIAQQQSIEDEAEGEHLEADGQEYVYLDRRVTAFFEKRDEQQKLHFLCAQSLQITLRKRLEKMIKLCNRLSISEDKLTGLFLYMGNYSLIVLEGTEDAIEIFCKEFNKRFAEFWSNNKVFLVEDNIKKNYFDSFVSKSVHPMHTNKIFLPKQADDEIFMGQQHYFIRSKLQSLCGKLLIEYDEQEEEVSLENSESEHETQHLDEYSEMLAQHLPEVERIELVLQSKRFYRNIEEFGKSYANVLMNLDDEDITWPLRNNYTPPGVYLTSMYDYNLTYPNSNTTSEEKTKRFSKHGVRLEDEDGEEEGGEDGGSDEYAPKPVPLIDAPLSGVSAVPSRRLTAIASRRLTAVASASLVPVPSLTLTAALSNRTLLNHEPLAAGDGLTRTLVFQ